MSGLRFLTAGESHGPAETSILEGLPQGLPLVAEDIDHHLARRQMGYGRGGRQKIETDRVRILSGTYQGVTIGSPLTLQIINRDYENWKDKPHKPVHSPRPGHGDLAGSMKYNLRDARTILERASARETVNRVAVGAVCQRLLREFDIAVTGRVRQVGDLVFASDGPSTEELHNPKEVHEDPALEDQRRAYFALVDRCRRAGDTLGGIVEVRVTGVPAGLGSHVHWDRRLDSRLGAAALSIPSVKAFEIGEGVAAAGRTGSEVHDAMYLDEAQEIRRRTNRAGGLEAGITNGEDVILKIYFKPIATIRKGLPSVNMQTVTPTQSDYERSDVTVLPAAAVVAEHVIACVIADAVCLKYGGDTLTEMRQRHDAFLHQLRQRNEPEQELQP